MVLLHATTDSPPSTTYPSRLTTATRVSTASSVEQPMFSTTAACSPASRTSSFMAKLSLAPVPPPPSAEAARHLELSPRGRSTGGFGASCSSTQMLSPTSYSPGSLPPSPFARSPRKLFHAPVRHTEARNLSHVMSDPPLPLTTILDVGAQRLDAASDHASPKLVAPELPPIVKCDREYLHRDAEQKSRALWSQFQVAVHYRVEHSNDPPEPPPAKPRYKSIREPQARRTKPATPPVPTDWAGKVALAIHQIIKKQHARVKDVFKKFDTDGSGALDASEFYGALIELGLHESLSMPEHAICDTLQEVFNTMDEDSNGTISYQEIYAYLRAGRHEVQLDEKLKPGAVAVLDAASSQTYRTRRKEEWKALERFKAIDVNNDGQASLRELMAFLTVEGYSEDFVKELLLALDVNSDGSISADEFRAGVRLLKGTTLLRSMTDPVQPPSNEKFADLRTPRELRYIEYGHVQKGTVLHQESEVTLGKKVTKGTTIEQPELRAITLGQLRALAEHVRRRVGDEKWFDTNGNVMRYEHVSMYDLAAYVVKPATTKRKCSLVELLSKAPQSPTWVVSHSWGQPFAEMIACIEQHAHDRRLDLNLTKYWISAFAYSQWNYTGHVTLDPTENTIYKAMDLADGLITILDKNADNCCFSRSWCMFELGLALQVQDDAKFLIDFYTPLNHRLHGELLEKDRTGDGAASDCSAGSHAGSDKKAKSSFYFSAGYLPVKHGVKPPPGVSEQRYAVGMTDGPAPGDYAFGTDHHAQTAREQHFPLHLLEAGLSTTVQGGSTSLDIDKTSILNSIAKAPSLDAEAPFTHPNFTAFNASIRGRIAQGTLVRSAVEAAKGEPAHLQKVLHGLSDSNLVKLEVPLQQVCRAGTSLSPEILEAIMTSIPRTVEHLVISLPVSIVLFPKGCFRRLPCLKTLEILSSISLTELPEDVIECSQLETLDLTGCKSMGTLPARIHDLYNLKTLNLTGCGGMQTLHAKGTTKSSLETLIMEGCIGLIELPEALGANLANLQYLNLHGCYNLPQTPAWLNKIEKQGAVMRPEHL